MQQLFGQKILNDFIQKQDEKLIENRWQKYKNFLAKKEKISSWIETDYQDGFLEDIFENCLGYISKTRSKDEHYTLEREKKNETNAQKADGALLVDDKVVAVIELKDLKTKDLDKKYNREESAVRQAFGYLQHNNDAKYVIVSNFNELRFYFDKATAYEQFFLFELDYEGFKKLHTILCYESISKELPHVIKEKSLTYEQDISNQLYKDYTAFRTKLFENILKNNPHIDKLELLNATQKLIDRIVFILFGEDTDLLPKNTIGTIIQRQKEVKKLVKTFTLYDSYKVYFEAINAGDEDLDITMYNGGLFAEDTLLNKLIIEDEVLDARAKILSAYNFGSDISVNILGHIFENSISELEEMSAQLLDNDFDKKQSKRKKDGVFYTPAYITEYIVQNTLGKLCEDKRTELNIAEVEAIANPKKPTKKEQETKENLLLYKEWLLNLKILDPACGSGAFLNQALEYLLKEHKRLQNDLALMGDLFASYEVEKEVLEHNLYGVDINEGAVEIARLSLWLRTAKRGRPLTKLANKIKVGNSLIDDKTVVPNAFDWHVEFPEVFAQGGFDVVIGNPPWNSKISNTESITISKIFNIELKNLNLFAVFFYLSNNIIKNNGYVNLLIPEVIIKNSSYFKLRDLLINEYNLQSLTNHGQFPGVASNTVDICYQKSVPNNVTRVCKKDSKSDNTKVIDTNLYNQNPIKAFSFEIDNEKQKILNNISKHTELGKLSKLKRGIELGQVTNLIKCDYCKKYTELSTKYYSNRDINKCKYCDSIIDTDKYFSISSRTKNERYKSPCLSGKEINRYIVNDVYYIIDDLLGIDYKSDIFSNENLFVKRIATKPEAMIVDFAYAFNTLYSIYGLNGISKKALLLIINSKLISFYYELVFNLGMDLTTQITVEYLKKLPICIPRNEDFFIQKADKMLELNKNLQETKQSFLNELKLEKLTKKLQNFEELTFEEFITEYTKSLKLKFADKLAERNFKQEWQGIFENDKALTCKLKTEIEKTDKEIDKMVYELYGLSDEEIKTVEGI